MMDIDGRNTNKLVFTIKPSPNIITPKIDANPQITKNEKGYNLELNIKGDSPWNFRRVLFNSKGEKDAWGKYSVIIGAEDKDYNDKAYRKYKVMQPKNPNVADGDIALMVNRKTREYFLSGKTETTSVLYECYPGLTVYEFNYDYVMGMQLFDPTVIVAQLVEALVNIQMGISANIKKTSDYKA
jgi:hypothetical protein